MGLKNTEKILLAYYTFTLNTIAVFSKKRVAQMAFDLFSTPHRKQSSVAPPLFKAAEEFELTVNGLSTYGYKWNSSAPKKVLLVHGFESRAYNFERYVAPLLEKGYGVFAMDAKAHGKSEGKTIILPEYVDMLKLLEKEVGKFHGFICHSFGGLATCLYQDQFNHPDARIVLIAPATETSSSLTLFCRLFALKTSVEQAIHALILAKSGHEVGFYSVKRIAQKISNPILWIHDKNDTITPLEDVLPLIEKNPKNIEFMITTQLGHRRIYKDAAVMQKVIEFL